MTFDQGSSTLSKRDALTSSSIPASPAAGPARTVLSIRLRWSWSRDPRLLFLFSEPPAASSARCDDSYHFRPQTKPLLCRFPLRCLRRFLPSWPFVRPVPKAFPAGTPRKGVELRRHWLRRYVFGSLHSKPREGSGSSNPGPLRNLCLELPYDAEGPGLGSAQPLGISGHYLYSVLAIGEIPARHIAELVLSPIVGEGANSPAVNDQLDAALGQLSSSVPDGCGDGRLADGCG
jgi:hypothetical protein